jgi:hypothetical protein
MKNNQLQILSRCFVGMVFCVVFSSTVAHSQGRNAISPVGEDLKYCANVTLLSSKNWDANVVLSGGDLTCFYYDKSGIRRETPHWRPQSSFIVGFKNFTDWNSTYSIYETGLKVLLEDGTIVKLYYLSATTAKGPVAFTLDKPVSPHGGYGETYKGVGGDATYVLSSWYVYVYRDSVSSWQVDSTGLTGATITGISLDTAQYVYAATTNGVFKQHPDSSVWHQITNLPTSYFSNILVDRFNRIFAANYVNYNGKGTHISTDNGSTWTLDSAGIGTMQIMKLTDDAYGNTYALNTDRVYRRANNTPGWTRIDGGITAITVNPVTINSVGGDSVLYAATSFGLYSSTDQGTTWADANAGIPAKTFWSFAKGASGKWFTSTSLAMYSLGPTDTAWTKVYPTSGYQGQLPIYTDGLGNIYTFGAGNNNNLLPVYKSTNGGTSWNIDTAGKSLVLGGGKFFIDEKGGQHASFDPYSGVSHLYTKPYGGSWGLDTAGFRTTSPNSYSSTAVIASDRHGYLYASGKYFNGSTRVTGLVIRRPIDGGTWAADTVGIPSGYNFCNALVPGKNGDMYAEFPPFLLHRSNSGTWSNINVPVITGSTNNSMALSVDSSGALFAAITGDDINYNFRGLGVYFSSDTGTTWKYAGLDSISVNQLVSYGDSTYAATNNGLYILTRTAAVRTGVQQVRAVPATYALYQNYPNPFNPTTTIWFSLAQRGHVSLKIFDILGREVATLVNGELEVGLHQATFDASKFASGVYFYRLQADNFNSVKKLVLMK